MQVLGITIDNLSRLEIETQIQRFLDEPKFHRVVTVNPEFLLLAEKNNAFAGALQKADLCVADGIGITFPFWLAGEKLQTRYPGADLLLWILKVAEEKKYSVGLILRLDGLSRPEEILAALKTYYPELRVTSQPEAADIVFSNLGAPLQELVLAALVNHSTSTRLAMGVGGAFDFLTGKIRRAPLFMRKAGLEWLWRLIHQPTRFRRIWNAVVVFPFSVLRQK